MKAPQLLALVVMLNAVSCDFADCSLLVKNNSEKDIIIDHTTEPSFDISEWVSGQEKSYNEGGHYLFGSDPVTKPGETQTMCTLNFYWPQYLQEKGSFVQIMILDVKYLKDTASMSISDALTVYKLNLQDIERLNWTIPFPVDTLVMDTRIELKSSDKY